MRKITAIIAAFAMMLCFAGCQGKNAPAPDSTEQTAAEDAAREQTAAPGDTQPSGTEIRADVMTREGERLGQIGGDSICTAADAGIFYSVFVPENGRYTAEAQYRFFRRADQKDVLLGTLEDQCYEAFYTRTELDGILYALAVTGDPRDDRADTLWLLAMDPAAETMTKYAVTEDGFPYTAMSAANGKLLIMNHEVNGTKCDKVYEFDPAEGTVREVLVFAEETDSLRSVHADQEGFYLLRLKVENGSPKGLWLDRYDWAYQKLSEQSLNEWMVPAALNIRGVTGETDAMNEFGMMVSGFAVAEGRYLFYENFGLVRLCIDLESGKALFAQDDVYSMLRGGQGFHRIGFRGEETAKPEILTLRDGKLEQLPFTPPDQRTQIQMISRSPGGTWLLRAADGTAAAQETDALVLWTE